MSAQNQEVRPLLFSSSQPFFHQFALTPFPFRLFNYLYVNISNSVSKKKHGFIFF